MELFATSVSWNINRYCNYKCSYCTQQDDKLKGQDVSDFRPFLDAFRQLIGPIEVKISGGEPFLYPDFLQMCREMRERHFYISIVTNFSAQVENLFDFLDVVGDLLQVFSASLHLEYADPGEFLAKALQFKQKMAANSSFVVTSVASPRHLTELNKIGRIFLDHGVRFNLQPLKYHGSIITYTQKESEILNFFGGHNRTGKICNNFFGRPCKAGINYFVVGPTGDVWRCYQAKKERKEYLGNILQGSFMPYTEIHDCIYHYCPCTVPIERKMIL